MITVENLSRNYGDFVAVDQVSFEIPRGAIVGLLGHNGAGKTTIMKMLTGFLEPTDGRAIIDGLDVSKNRLQIQEKIGYLPENSPIYPEMTVIEYLEFVAELRNIPQEKQQEAIQNAVTRTHLQEKATDLISTLSRGYKQRVGVAQAVLHEPEILILDEPTNGLDPTQIHDMRKLIKTLSEKATVILSTHILQEVQAMCDRVLIVSRGKLVLHSRLEELSSGNKILVESNKDSSALKEILGSTGTVKEIEPSIELNGGRVGHFLTRLELSSDNYDEAAVIPKLLIEKGCELYSFRREERSLESVFEEVSA